MSQWLCGTRLNSVFIIIDSATATVAAAAAAAAAAAVVPGHIMQCYQRSHILRENWTRKLIFLQPYGRTSVLNVALWAASLLERPKGPLEVYTGMIISLNKDITIEII